MEYKHYFSPASGIAKRLKISSLEERKILERALKIFLVDDSPNALDAKNFIIHELSEMKYPVITSCEKGWFVSEKGAQEREGGGYVIKDAKPIEFGSGILIHQMEGTPIDNRPKWKKWLGLK